MRGRMSIEICHFIAFQIYFDSLHLFLTIKFANKSNIYFKDSRFLLCVV